MLDSRKCRVAEWIKNAKGAEQSNKSVNLTPWPEQVMGSNHFANHADMTEPFG
jgi:hypothetical protein